MAQRIYTNKAACSANTKPAVFLDRDGTLIEDRGHLREVSEVKFLPGTFEALTRLQEHFLLFIVTNQSGVAKGAISLDNVEQINAHVVRELAKAGVDLTDVFSCPHDRAENCECIKPKTFFMRTASRTHHIDLRESFVVGDHPHDVEMADNAGACGIYVLTGHGEKHRSELRDGTHCAPGILDAADMIMEMVGSCENSK